MRTAVNTIAEASLLAMVQREEEIEQQLRLLRKLPEPENENLKPQLLTEELTDIKQKIFCQDRNLYEHDNPTWYLRQELVDYCIRLGG
ncbi:hypothetical protein N7499_010485 [Penicillium canescens]|uniref:Uncharacterized protein n=1 Tax=Penicillium canescens TaxID=5083 RepID=A0AAD6NBK0_PENCN|nr:uncharacterized protein N7446_005752 [Penicillium canescens]KAJ6051120.1 hypothetical protein N7460_001654 [Penicillium canescens]KAJ6061632.1 hypothetical protein N7446_005752 [Penicillium canescens]KAJ6064879.1 hypothetical protein N7444_000532 [Penicillium canescens]KAJ6068598.1 hypothetical protein N7499_010485 [Penicillium canescens]KAJ6183349.1 hypothetical protein N7485_001991 [Penicillium canescens]